MNAPQTWTLTARSRDEPRFTTGTDPQNKRAAHAFAKAAGTVVRCERPFGAPDLFVHPDGRVKRGNGDFK